MVICRIRWLAWAGPECSEKNNCHLQARVCGQSIHIWQHFQ